ncbi:hypothetical protein [Mangrovibacterium lignilyticum]|uniref:hypothetical protein n=1 Tax=Mangrovibacterium lignilyticum TaxID=2668052 RepID=UPI0013D5A792|nr:hypothetical protein [Mangrovibacterium lignilyticum]
MKLLNFTEGKNAKRKLNEDIIQLVSCPANGNVCSQNLVEINRLLSTAQQSRFSKEYGRSIYKMQKALAIADGIQTERCANCAVLFRNTILSSMDNVKEELEEMSKGLFSTRYRESFKQVSTLVQELKQV